MGRPSFYLGKAVGGGGKKRRRRRRRAPRFLCPPAAVATGWPERAETGTRADWSAAPATATAPATAPATAWPQAATQRRLPGRRRPIDAPAVRTAGNPQHKESRRPLRHCVNMSRRAPQSFCRRPDAAKCKDHAERKLEQRWRGCARAIRSFAWFHRVRWRRR